MPKFKFSKLVRDKIVEHQVATGARPSYRRLKIDEHKQALIDKIIEESKEVLTAKPEDVALEIADVQQAVDDLIALYSMTRKDILNAQKLKLNKNGGFSEGIFIDYVDVDEDDEWVKYYRDNSERYPEVV